MLIRAVAGFCLVSLDLKEKYAKSSSMDFFARLIDSWLWFVYFPFTSKETRQNPATAVINVKIMHSF